MGGPGSGDKRRTPSTFVPDEGVQLWERHSGETDTSWNAFKTYRDLGGERSLAKTADSLGKRPQYKAALEDWSRKFEWRLRVEAWDRHLDLVERTAQLDAAAKKASDMVNTADGMWKIAARSLLMWNRFLDRHDQREAFEIKQHYKENPKEPPPAKAPPISPADTHRLADAGMKLSQLLQGKPTEIEEQRAQITIEERRKGLRAHITNPKLREAMRQVNEAMKDDVGDGVAH